MFTPPYLRSLAVPLAIRARSTRGLRPAFTLLELLIVVSIIGLLLSILLPALKRAREQARQAVCTSRLKSIATASLVYATGDAQEQCVPIHPGVPMLQGDRGAHEWGGKSGGGLPVSGTDPVESVWGTAYGRGPASRPLNSLVCKSGFVDFVNDPGPGQGHWLSDFQLELPLFRCPNDRGYTGHHYQSWKQSGLTSYDHFGNSYAANAFWAGSPRSMLSGAPRPIVTMSPFLSPVSRVGNPAKTIYFVENAGRFGWHVNYWWAGSLPESAAGPYPLVKVPFANTIRGWHGRLFHFTASFVDGHAATVAMRGHQDPAPRLSRYPGRPWLQFESGFPNDEVAYQYWRPGIIRSPDWQIDMLPSAPTMTHVPANLSGEIVDPIE